MKHDLEERTKKFGKDILSFAKDIQLNHLNKNIIDQLLRSALSVGANYKEANAGCSKKDFRNKISICRKEISETEYWLEILAEVNQDEKSKLRSLWKESRELTMIFSKIFHSLK
jgi:four helix bundle protein